MGHRFLAYLILALTLLLLAVSRGQVRSYPRAALFTFLILNQILLGVVNVLWQIPTPITLLHLANAFLLFALAVDTSLRLALVPTKRTTDAAKLSSRLIPEDAAKQVLSSSPIAGGRLS
jgi:heme A synthase